MTLRIPWSYFKMNVPVMFRGMLLRGVALSRRGRYGEE